MSTQETNNIGAMDFVLEYAIKHGYKATVSECMKQIPEGKELELRQCTMKALVVFYSQSIVFRNERKRLPDCLLSLQKLCVDIEDKKLRKAWHALERGLKYQIVMYHLDTCGAQTALQTINTHFASTLQDPRDTKFRQILSSFCEKRMNDEPIKPIKWDKFKGWSKPSFASLLENCGVPMIERVATSRVTK
eukprot:751114_1